MSEKTFNTGEINLNYIEGPSNGPPLLLLHGLNSIWQSFHFIIPQLEKHWHIYALDLRGHGKSDRAVSYRIQEYVSDIISFIKNCIQEPATIFGHSYGGQIAIMAAAYHPERVKGLIIGDSILSLNFLKQYSAASKETTAFWRDLARTKSFDTIVSELKNHLMPVPGQQTSAPAAKVLGEDNPYFKYLGLCLSHTDPEVLTADVEFPDDTYADYQTNKLFPQIQCPVLFLQANAKLGGLMREEDLQKAMSLLPGSQHVKIEKAGHFLITEDIESVVNAIVPFKDSLV